MEMETPFIYIYIYKLCLLYLHIELGMFDHQITFKEMLSAVLKELKVQKV